MADLDGMQISPKDTKPFPLRRGASLDSRNRAGSVPSPFKQHTTEKPQLFGLAASIAARLTIWPISLACSASERIWD